MEIVISSPLTGRLTGLSEVNDSAFSLGILGRGIAIIPTDGMLYAPADGKITMFYPTGHAIGMEINGDIELLIHVGIETSKLKGEGFLPRVSAGDFVNSGDLLLEFDIGKIKSAGYDIVTPIVIPNVSGYSEMIFSAAGNISQGDALFKIKITEV